jgi:hypothetical protein
MAMATATAGTVSASTTLLKPLCREVLPALQLVGKGGYHRRKLNAVGGLASLHDSLTGTEFLVDNCATVSVLPHWGASSGASSE